MTASTGLYQVFRWVKYLTYALLSLNIWLFFSEELNSARFAIETGEEVALGVQLFSATLDTLAWVILLLLFELETAVIPDERLRGKIRFGIHGVRMLCTAAIVMAFLGYFGEWLTLLPSELLSGDACSRVTESWSVMIKLDDFMPLTAENCGQFGADTRIVLGLDQVMASPAGLLEGQRLALVDVINSAAWILVVILLEIEVRVLTRWGGASMPLSQVATFAKAVLYATLVAAAIYWGFKGDFLDFWDAALWLFAFVFIELNVFEWQQELRDQTSETPVSAELDLLAEVEVVVPQLLAQPQHLESLLCPPSLLRFERFFGDGLRKVHRFEVIVFQFAQSGIKQLFAWALGRDRCVSLTHKSPPDDFEQKTSTVAGWRHQSAEVTALQEIFWTEQV